MYKWITKTTLAWDATQSFPSTSSQTPSSKEPNWLHTLLLLSLSLPIANSKISVSNSSKTMLLLPPPSLQHFPANFSSNFSSKSPKQPPFRSCPQPLRAVNRRPSDDVDSFTKKSGYIFELASSEADSLIEYDIKRIAAICRRKPLILLRRLFQIGTTFGRWFGARYIDSLAEKSDQMFEVWSKFIIIIFFFLYLSLFFYERHVNV